MASAVGVDLATISRSILHLCYSRLWGKTGVSRMIYKFFFPW